MINRTSDRFVLQKELEKIVVQIILKEPFYGYILSFISRTFSTKVKRISMSLLSDEGILFTINPEHWRSLKTEEEKIILLLENILHLVFKHPFVQHKFQSKQLANLAFDMTVGQQLGEGKATPKNQKLQQMMTNTSSQSGGNNPQNPMDIGEGKLSQSKGDQKSGSEKNYQFLTRNMKDQKVQEFIKENLEQAQQKEWNIPESEAEVQEEFVNGMIEEAAKRIPEAQWGRIPAGLQQYIQQIIESRKPSYNWRRALKTFANSSKKTRLKTTMKRRSSRYGTFPGIKIQNKLRLLVAIDTSASVDNEQLAIFFAELDHIHKTGAEIEIVECDAAIQKKYVYTGIPVKIKGRGGTSFDPVLEYAIQNRPDGLIYFTDGEAAEPQSQYNPTFWLIHNQKDFDTSHLTGRKVILN